MQQEESELQEQSEVVAIKQFLDELGRDDVAKMNLVGFFDVLIEMDLELREQERNQTNEKRHTAS